MLTLTHIVDEQAATLAACPRPRALAALAGVVAVTPSIASWPAAAAPSVAASRAGFGSVAVLRLLADERPTFGYGLRREMAGFGSVSAAPAGAGVLGSGIEHERITSNKQSQQNLTHRREPRTWRPPH